MNNNAELNTLQRYLRLAVIIIAAGAIYPLIYLRQNFEITILETYGIDAFQLGQCYSLLGVIFVATYIPSGWLADRVKPSILMAFSLALAGLLGVWFASVPDFSALRWIFVGWGIATGLTFWVAHLKATMLLARREEQGRFLGTLDAGRGLYEAILATIVVGVFAYAINSLGESNATALNRVIWIYVTCMLVLSPIVFFMLKESSTAKIGSQTADINLWVDLRTILSKPEVWLCGFCILTGYQLFWATYSFSAYMETNYGLTAVAVGTITVAKLWMRPIGAAAAGFVGDFLGRERVLGWLLLTAAIALGGMVMMPTTAGTTALLGIVLLIGFLTYAVRGIFWATLDSCNIDNRIKGLAIGIVSFIGYSPDIYLPLINGALVTRYPGKLGYDIYFTGIVVFGVLGAIAAWKLQRMVAAKQH
ncbi:MAG: MFS transporter [Pseudomonadota bacterium]